ncbi:hypothetical protein K1719_028131 [Acacia pycnantha]|nr:hypothetical protein K1719_028131 [Acacia pycnantha]
MLMIAFRYGACYVLLKPVSEGDLKNLWQHIYRRWQHIYRSREQKRREVVQTEQQPNSDVDDPDPDQIRQNLNPDKDPKPKSDVEKPDQIRQNLNPDNDPKPNSDVEDLDQIQQNLNPDKDPKVVNVREPNLIPDKDPKVVNVREYINFVGASSLKKPRRQRIVWIPELHKKFLYAVEKLDGAEKAVPKAILEAMDIPSLTRANVASHLQVERH